jgi:hypothetical protein
MSDTLEIPSRLHTRAVEHHGSHMHVPHTEGMPHMGLGSPVYPPNVLNLAAMCHVSPDEVMTWDLALDRPDMCSPTGSPHVMGFPPTYRPTADIQAANLHGMTPHLPPANPYAPYLLAAILVFLLVTGLMSKLLGAVLRAVGAGFNAPPHFHVPPPLVKIPHDL